jgi:hypothetical protein
VFVTRLRPVCPRDSKNAVSAEGKETGNDKHIAPDFSGRVRIKKDENIPNFDTVTT